MNKVFLVVEGRNLETNKPVIIPMIASNPFMMAIRYNQFITRNIWIESWSMATVDGTGGNAHPCNAGAYLHEWMEELTGEKL